MKEEKSLIDVKSDRKGIRRIVNNVVELIKSKLDKNYFLSEKSPDFLKRNKDLILKTIKRDSNYLNQVPEDILLEELQQGYLPNGIIDTAFKRGYELEADPNRRN